MTDVTVEKLKKELHRSQARTSYYKNKNKRPKRKATPADKATMQVWNDRKNAQIEVIVSQTASSEEERIALRKELYRSPIENIRELAKGYESEVAAEIEKRIAARAIREAQQAKKKATTATPTPTTNTVPKPVLIRPPQKTISRESREMREGTPRTAPPPSLNDVDKAKLEEVRQVVSKRLEIDLTTAQAVSHVLARYLKNYN